MLWNGTRAKNCCLVTVALARPLSSVLRNPTVVTVGESRRQICECPVLRFDFWQFTKAATAERRRQIPVSRGAAGSGFETSACAHID